MNGEVKVSVCVITYNHAEYIESCLQSLVEQETVFSFEIIVADDCSTDSTSELVLNFEKKYPNKIFSIIRAKNIGATKNYLDVHSRARGNIVFHMDGDDVAYPGKLNIQYNEFMKDPSLVCCWHRAAVFNDSGKVIRIREENLEKIINPYDLHLKDILKWGVLGCHSSMAYRKSIFDKIEFPEGDILDVYISGCLLAYGKGVNLPSVLGGYRENENVQTVSNIKKTLWFKPSSCKHVFYENYSFFLEQYPQYKKYIFLNILYNFFVDLKNARLLNVFLASRLLIKSFSFSSFSVSDIIKYFKLKRKLINK